MPGLIGYMLAIVITLSGYFAALNWLIRPPDPWQSSAKMPASAAQHAARKRPPVVKPAEAANSESTALTEPDTRLASIEPPAPFAGSENETTQPVEPNVVQAQLPTEATRAVVETPHVARRDVSATKTRPGNRKRVERLMREEGLQGIYRRRGRRNLVNAATEEDLVRRQFTAEAPDRLWLTDITEHPAADGKAYCAAVMDAYSRRIIGWSIDKRQDTDLVVAHGVGRNGPGHGSRRGAAAT